MTSVASSERRDLIALLEQLGPDAATLCDGWTTRELAAHLVLRERRPDAAAGISVGPLAGHTARVQERIARQDWDLVLGQLRSPPLLSAARVPGLDDVVNAQEFFVHHEDVRRAQGHWAPRPMSPEREAEAWTRLTRMSRLLFRHAPVGVRLVRPDGTAHQAHGGTPVVTLTGPPGELVLFAYGRGEHARVEVSGPGDAVAALRAADLGV